MSLVRHLPNLLSLSRIPLLFTVSLVLYVSVPYKYTAALALFVLASITDYLDGKAARHFNVVTPFGILFDALCDKILVLGIFVTMLAFRLYPPSYAFAILFVLTREFVISGLRMVAASRGLVLAAEKSGKVKTAIQMVAVCLSLGARAIPEWTARHVGLFVGMVVSDVGDYLFLFSTGLAVFSGALYLRKYGHILTDLPEKKPRVRASS